ncbi:MAG: KamA family radical SAM protein [Nitrospinae bacterium]|nr:KamA family radical SAM protein [Nitrospinota bacterium]
MESSECSFEEPPSSINQLSAFSFQLSALKKYNSTKAVPKELWNDWRWQLKNRITTLQQLEEIIILTPEEKKGVLASGGRLAMAITPYFASLIDPYNPNCPVRRQAVPRIEESYILPHDMVDPCGEDTHSPVPGLVHRYPDRALLIVTDQCAMYCRYCTRRRMVGAEENVISRDRLEDVYSYLRTNRKIRDVLISGGDPLLLKEEILEGILSNLRRIPNIEIIRLGTRVPVTLPQRIDTSLADMLKKYHPLWMSIHFSHPKEITKDVKRACGLLSDAGIPLGSQTVLLRGINDKPHIMKKLIHELLKMRVRPYYIYQCDPAVGTGHFRTPVSAGINIIEKLRGHTTGYGVPTFVVDAPGGGGKIPVAPVYLISQADGRVTLRNYEGKIFEYYESPKQIRRIDGIKQFRLFDS